VNGIDMALQALMDAAIDRAKAAEPPPIPFVPADPSVCTCVDPFSNCPSHG
jgi:hypothetical protein